MITIDEFSNSFISFKSDTLKFFEEDRGVFYIDSTRKRNIIGKYIFNIYTVYYDLTTGEAIRVKAGIIFSDERYPTDTKFKEDVFSCIYSAEKSHTLFKQVLDRTFK